MIHNLPGGWQTRTVFHTGDDPVVSVPRCGVLSKESCAVLHRAYALAGDGALITARYNWLVPGSVLQRHQSGQNLRLKAHLGLEIPSGSRLSFLRESFA